MPFCTVNPHTRLVSCNEVLGVCVWNLITMLLFLEILCGDNETQNELELAFFESLPIAVLEQIRVRVASTFEPLRLIFVLRRELVQSTTVEFVVRHILCLIKKAPHQPQYFVQREVCVGHYFFKFLAER